MLRPLDRRRHPSNPAPVRPLTAPRPHSVAAAPCPQTLGVPHFTAWATKAVRRLAAKGHLDDHSVTFRAVSGAALDTWRRLKAAGAWQTIERSCRCASAPRSMRADPIDAAHRLEAVGPKSNRRAARMNHSVVHGLPRSKRRWNLLPATHVFRDEQEWLRGDWCAISTGPPPKSTSATPCSTSA